MHVLVALLLLVQDDLEKVRRQATQALENKQFDKAIELFAKILKDHPDDDNALYNTACAYALLGKKDEAVEFLRKSVEAGFTDFDHIQKDTDLDSIRDTDGYKAVMAKREEIEKTSVEKRLAKTKEKLGDSYREIRDEERKIILLSDVPENELKQYLDLLLRYEDALHQTFFEHLPDYYILVLIPSNSDEYYKKLGGSKGAAGFYNPSTRTLTVNLKTGAGTIVHEWTHAMHFADQHALRQDHPQWLIEGFGSLYEQTNIEKGRPVGFTNWRLPGIQSAIKNNKRFPMRDFITRSSFYFQKDVALAYAQTRYIFYWLQGKNQLQDFYKAFVKGYAEDKTGIAALEKVLGKKVEEWEAEWEEFVLGLRFGNAGPDRPKIGVNLEPVDKGLKITSVVEGSGGAEAGLQKDDIILEFNDQKVATVAELQKLLEKCKKGDFASLKIERAGEPRRISVKLN